MANLISRSQSFSFLVGAAALFVLGACSDPAGADHPPVQPNLKSNAEVDPTTKVMTISWEGGPASDLVVTVRGDKGEGADAGTNPDEAREEVWSIHCPDENLDCIPNPIVFGAESPKEGGWAVLVPAKVIPADAPAVGIFAVVGERRATTRFSPGSEIRPVAASQ